MLEDCTISMEKKPLTRSAQPLGKSSGTDSKKSQDVVGSKPAARLRRRESAGTNCTASKYESARKPVPQKSKSFDKRPRARGQYCGSGKEDSKVAVDESAEYGSVFVPGSKKQNLNHLLNFHYAPRGSMPSQGPGWVRSQRWLPGTYKHKYNKEHFLQANCQFVVKSNGDYSSYLNNPDTLVDWDLVEQIRVHSDETLSCPICLSPPVAARMTRCGHVYCWPCVLHYLALSDKAWRSCPICYEAVHRNGLRSVVAVRHNHRSVGDEVTMLLMCRERGSLVATPIGQSEFRSANQLLSVSETALDTVYSKLLVATPAEVMELLASERAQLEAQLKEEQGCPESCFTEQALELLSQRLATLVAGPECPAAEPPTQGDDKYALVYSESAPDLPMGGGTVDESEDVVSELDRMPPPPPPHDQRPRYESVSSSEGGGTEITADDLEIGPLQPAAAQKQFFFYQASDGQHVYLHALNVRMLEMQYGSLGQCPAQIRGRIVEKEAGSMTEDLRKRLRYLQHLSVTCQFEVAELELRPPVVSREILSNFQDQLEIRKRRRQSRAKQERRREKKITEVENRLLGRHPTPNVHIESTRHFPEWDPELQALASPTGQVLWVASPLSSLGSSPREAVISPLTAAVEALDIDPQDQSHGVSFAKMLREGKSRPGGAEWPAAAAARPAEARRRVASDSEPEPEGYVPAPSFSQSFSTAIAAALERAEAQQTQGIVEPVNGKKKKKNKKTLLFTTSMACTGK